MFPKIDNMIPPKTSGSAPADLRVGATIREMRTMRGFTQEQLATAALVSRAYLSNVEAGRKRPSGRVVARIADALRVPQLSIIAAKGAA